MTPMLEAYRWFVILYWLAMIPIAAYIFYFVAGYFTGEYPSNFRRAILMVLATAAAVYITYDATGYLFVLMMQDPSLGLQFPAHYTFWNWLQEPIALKWHVLGIVPIIRFLPIIFALCVGGTLQAIFWSESYRVGAVLFLAQVFLDLLAMLLLSFVFSLALHVCAWAFHVQPDQNPQAEQAADVPEAPAQPANMGHLAQRVKNLGPERSSFWRRINADWESVNQHLQPLYGLLQPITSHLPMPAQDFLNGGGWPTVLLSLVLLGVLWPRVHRRRKHRFHPPKRHVVHGHDRLALIGDAMTGLGPKQVTVRGRPARLRLVVLAPAASGSPAITKEMAPRVLEALRPGLAEVARSDVPRVESWSSLHSGYGFRHAFEKEAELPESKGQSSHWVLLVGRSAVGPVAVYVGLALYTSDATNLGLIEVPSSRWSQILDLRTVPDIERD